MVPGLQGVGASAGGHGMPFGAVGAPAAAAPGVLQQLQPRVASGACQQLGASALTGSASGPGGGAAGLAVWRRRRRRRDGSEAAVGAVAAVSAAALAPGAVTPDPGLLTPHTAVGAGPNTAVTAA